MGQWVSFLDGMQRVLLFTDDPGRCWSLTQTTGENERIAMVSQIKISMSWYKSAVCLHLGYD